MKLTSTSISFLLKMLRILFHYSLWDSSDIITSSVQFQLIHKLATYQLHRCKFHWLVNTGHRSYNCSGHDNPFHMCRMGRDVSIYSHPSQTCIHTLLSRGDTCNVGRQYESESMHFIAVIYCMGLPCFEIKSFSASHISSHTSAHLFILFVFQTTNRFSSITHSMGGIH